MERVPTTKQELTDIVNKYKGHLIATTACLGGELSTHALAMYEAQMVNDIKIANEHYQ
jgi:DNA polymerase-3 subunit alpha